ncbi:MAG: creatininase family protein [Victivallaceae bacterium]
MIDFNRSSPEWAGRDTDILVFGIGALEQHGPHLPLKVDIMGAEHAAGVIAEHFNAALLPTLPFGTSLEHKNFAGTFSLRPKTLARVVKDIARAAREQKFRILIVVSGHGGNHILIPACREFNRKQSELRILLVFPSEFAVATDSESIRRQTLDIHAGEFETSRFLAMGGELTAPLPSGVGAEEIPVKWKQQDLTSFGIGRMSPSGVLGLPEFATAEKGEQLHASIRENMLRHLEDRIGRIRQNPEY